MKRKSFVSGLWCMSHVNETLSNVGRFLCIDATTYLPRTRTKGTIGLSHKFTTLHGRLTRTRLLCNEAYVWMGFRVYDTVTIPFHVSSWAAGETFSQQKRFVRRCSPNIWIEKQFWTLEVSFKCDWWLLGKKIGNSWLWIYIIIIWLLTISLPNIKLNIFENVKHSQTHKIVLGGECSAKLLRGDRSANITRSHLFCRNCVRFHCG